MRIIVTLLTFGGDDGTEDHDKDKENDADARANTTRRTVDHSHWPLPWVTAPHTFGLCVEDARCDTPEDEVERTTPEQEPSSKLQHEDERQDKGHTSRDERRKTSHTDSSLQKSVTVTGHPFQLTSVSLRPS